MMSQLRWLSPVIGILCIALLSSISEAAYCKPDPYTLCWPTSTRLAGFRASLSNASQVIMPGAPEFLGSALVMNSLKAEAPAFIVYPGTEADLLATVAFASRKCIRLVVRCSGHDYNDRSTGLDVIQLNTQRLKSIRYNASTQLVTISAGCNWGDVYSFMANNTDRIVVGGSSKSVCTAGYLLGGGHGAFSPQYGLGADNVEVLRVALYNGTAIEATPTVNSDLFHAMLGSGASTYGVLISVTYRTHPATPFVTAIFTKFPVPSEAEAAQPSIFDYILNATWFENKPLTLVGYHAIIAGVVSVQWVYVGYNDTQYAAAMDYIAPTFELPGISYFKATNFSNMYEYAVATYDAPSNLWARKLVSNAMLPVDQAVLDTFRAAIIAHPELPFWLWQVFGGATVSGTAGSVPPGLRNGLGEVSWGSQWVDPAQDDDQMQVVSAITDAIFPLVPNSYVNEYSAWHDKYNAVPDWQTRFYSNFDSLLQVKKKYDPCNLYTVEYGVGYGLPTATCMCK